MNEYSENQYGRVQLREGVIYDLGPFRIKLVEGVMDLSANEGELTIRPYVTNVIKVTTNQ